MSAETETKPPIDPRLANDFWTRPRKTIEELAAEQGVKPWTLKTIAEIRALAKEIWPEDDIEEFLVWLREIRGKPPLHKEPL